MMLVFKAALSVVFLLVVNQIAQRNPTSAGWVAVLPIMTLMSVGLLLLDGRDTTAISDFMIGAWKGIVPTFALFALVALGLRLGWSLTASAMLGIAGWLLLVLAGNRLGWFKL